jgi:glycosyltransferase involved in cell wall biosynthesis
LRGDLEEIVRCLALTERVRFAGDRPDVERLLTGADMATLSSSSEGTSLSLLEAMATGLPVVATRVGGNPDIVVDGHNGVLVGQDRADYAAALVALIESEAMRRALGENARETVIREWSAARMARQYEAVYTELGT